MWTTEAFDNEILLYYSIFPHGLSLKNKGEMRKSYHKTSKIEVQGQKLTWQRLHRTQDWNRLSTLQLVRVEQPGSSGEGTPHTAIYFKATSLVQSSTLPETCGLQEAISLIS